VFDGRSVSAPRFLNRFLGKIPIHLIQGLRQDAELLEALLVNQGYSAAERIDYLLMGFDLQTGPQKIDGPQNLLVRKPLPGEEDKLFALQAAYEQEEVLPKNAVFTPTACRRNLERILASEQILAAELDGQLVGKINTSAESFTRYQIGGVYVRPDCRGRGIATKMAAVFAQELSAQGKGITLFVKKRNPSAIKVYSKVGFKVLGDYRICYY
jgi:predicted GNAT family acetyltransferase